MYGVWSCGFCFPTIKRRQSWTNMALCPTVRHRPCVSFFVYWIIICVFTKLTSIWICHELFQSGNCLWAKSWENWHEQKHVLNLLIKLCRRFLAGNVGKWCPSLAWFAAKNLRSSRMEFNTILRIPENSFTSGIEENKLFSWIGCWNFTYWLGENSQLYFWYRFVQLLLTTSLNWWVHVYYLNVKIIYNNYVSVCVFIFLIANIF